MFRGTLINTHWQLFKPQRGALPHNLRKVGARAPLAPMSMFLNTLDGMVVNEKPNMNLSLEN